MSYNTKAVMQVIGLTMRQIDYWDRTHFIKPSVQEAAGHGTARLYSFTDLVQLKVAKALLDGGVSLQKIRKAIIWLKKNFPDMERPLAELRFLTDGDTIFVLTEKNTQIIDTLKKGQVVIALALGDIIEDLMGVVKKISQERRYRVSVKRKTYEVVLHPDLEDGGFWVDCPSLPGCSSQGDTTEEALEMIKDAISAFLEAKEEDKKKGRASA